MIVDVLHGICMCDKEWIKPEHRVDQHLAMFGVGEICPDCGHLIDWYAEHFTPVSMGQTIGRRWGVCERSHTVPFALSTRTRC